MKTLLVPVDFTATSDNAVNFAAAWSLEYGYDRIILLKSLYDSVFETVVVAAEYANLNEDNINHERQAVEEELQDLCRDMAAKTPHAKVLTAVSETPLLRAIIELVHQEHPNLIILGSDHHSYSTESAVANNIIAIAKASPVRVLVVPANATYKPVSDVLVPCDFGALASLEKVNNLKAIPQWCHLRLHVLNVDAKERYLQPDEKFKEREQRLHEYLKNFDHHLYCRNDRNILSAIAHFTREHDVQLLIALPGKQSFLYNLTHSHILEALYRNAHLPVLILK